jgi:hypothetical protein
MRPSRGLPLRFQAALVILFFIAVLCPAYAQNSTPLPPQWNEAVGRLADKIAAGVSPLNPISLATKNISRLSVAKAVSVRAALEAELKNRSFRLVPADSASADAVTNVQITLSEGAEAYIWIAEIRSAQGATVAMVSLKKGLNNGEGTLRSSLILQRDLIDFRPEPFLDFNEERVAQFTRLLTLQDGAIVTYDISYGWEQGSGSAQPFRKPPEGYRDFRGRLSTDGNRIEAHIGGAVCVGGRWNPYLECGLSPNDRWLFSGIGESAFAPGRNYFLGFTAESTGVTGTKIPFYSSATFQTDHISYWILSELDGKARLYEQSHIPSAVFSDWGDDLTSITSGCDTGWYVLVTGTGDWTQPDRIQAYEVDRTTYQATAVGQPLQLSGPVLTLWPADDGKSARVVSRNLQTGMYEASIVSVSCGN